MVLAGFDSSDNASSDVFFGTVSESPAPNRERPLCDRNEVSERRPAPLRECIRDSLGRGHNAKAVQRVNHQVH